MPGLGEAGKLRGVRVGDRFHPPERLRQLMADGHVGRKAGQGFYRYGEDGKRVD